MKPWAIVPELILLGMCLGLTPAAAFTRGTWRLLPAVVAIIGLLCGIGMNVWMLQWEPLTTFHGVYAIDGFANVFKLLIQLGALISLLLIIAYFRQHMQVAHAPVAIVFSTLGAVGMASSLDLGLIILFLQLMSMAGYVLAALVRSDNRALEASIKYFIYGAVALAIVAYGLTFIYGLTGSLNLQEIGTHLPSADRVWLGVAFALILVGYGFEMTMVPFHVWAPDLFSGATAPIAGYLSVVPKIAGFAGLLRFLIHAVPGELIYWPLVIAVLSAITMTFGNLVALRQNRLKRLLAYSSIAQAGYALMAVAAVSRSTDALSAVGFYLGAYLLMNLAAFAVVAHMERTWGSDAIDALRGTGFRVPLPALVMALALLSLAGIPPLVGFAGKVLLLKVAIEGGMAWLAVIGALNMTVALYYYVRIIGVMYFRDASATDEMPRDPAIYLTYAITTLGLLALGVLPGALVTLTNYMRHVFLR